MRRLAVLLVLASWSPNSATAQPATVSSLPWDFQDARALAVAGSTVYLSTNGQVRPDDGAARGLSVFSVAEGVAEPGASADGTVFDTIEDGAGGWYISGDFSTVGGLPRRGVARILASGAVDPAFVVNLNPNGFAYALARNGSHLILGGSFTTVNLVARQNFAVVDAASGLVQAPALAVTGDIQALAVTGSTIVMAGGFTAVGGVGRVGVATANAATYALVAGFVANVAPAERVWAVAAAGTALYLGGDFTSVNGVARLRAARVDLASGVVDPTWNPSANDRISALAVDGGVVYAGGNFSVTGGQPRAGLAALNTTTGAATAWQADVDGYVIAVKVHAASVFATGAFDRVNGVARRGAVRLGTTAPVAVLPWFPATGPGAGSGAIAAAGNRIAIGGSILGSDVEPRRSVVGLDLLSGELLPWRYVANQTIDVMAVAGTRLILAEVYTGPGIRTRLLAVDLATHAVQPLNVDIDGTVRDMAVAGTTLYVGGTFTEVNSSLRLNLAAIDLGSGQVLPWDPQADGDVYALATRFDRVFVGGSFTSLIGTNGFHTRASLGEITAAGQVTAFDAAITGPVVVVRDIGLSGTRVFFSGPFTAVHGSGRAGAAAVDASTGAVLPWNPGVTGTAISLSVHRNRVYLVGPFSMIGGQLRDQIACVDDALGAPTSWVPVNDFGSMFAVHADDHGVLVAGRDRRRAAHFFAHQHAGAPAAAAMPTARILGSALTLAWQPPATGPRPSGYRLEAGSAPGLADVATVPVAGTSFAVNGVPPATFFLRIRAVGPGGVGAASREMRVTVGGAGCTAPPRTPAPPAVTVAGSTVILAWEPSSGSAPTSYVLQVGTAAGLSNVGVFALGAATSFSAAGVPPGVFFVRVQAANGCGAHAPSADAVVRVGGATGPPGAPLQFTGLAGAGAVTLLWVNSTAGGVPTGHVLEAGTGPGLANLVTIPLGAAPSFGAMGVPPGTYYLRVRAVNAAGSSPPSGEVVLIVP